MAFPVFFDTCALFGAALCDTFLSIAELNVFTPYWSHEVLDAVERNVVARGHASPEVIASRVAAMERAFPGAMVTGYESLVATMTNHPGDRHVLAACVTSPAHTLVTFNVRDFEAQSTAPFGIQVVHPDDFLLDQLDLHPELVRQAIGNLLQRHARPPRDTCELADVLRRSSVPNFAAQIED